MKNPDLLVIGGGPAGLGAAIEAARNGIDVLLVDEQTKPGGQLFKQIHKFFGSKEHYAGVRGFDIGVDLLEKSDKAGVCNLLSTKVLGIFSDMRVSLLSQENKVFTLQPKAVVIATGGVERGVPFTGWTLPGVITAGSAQTFCNIHRVLPGAHVVMLGSGNVGLVVSHQLLQAGVNVLALVESNNYLGGYQVHAAKILRAGVPILTGYTVKEARGEEYVEEVVLSAVNSSCEFIPGSEKVLKADTICMAVGLDSNNKLSRMAGCEMSYSSEFGDDIPRHNKYMETSVPGIFVAGDSAGVEEANTALEEGRIAGIGAAYRLGKVSEEILHLETDKVWNRLDALRSGNFGILRKTGKSRIISSFSPLNDTYPTENDNVLENSCDSSFLIGDDPPPEGKGKQPVAVLYCDQDIPCDPCVAICPFGAITMTPSITGIPHVDKSGCTGCGLCLPVCPGHAIYLFQEFFDEERSALTFVYEYLPLPKEGMTVQACDRFGDYVCEAEVVRVVTGKKQQGSPLVTIAYETEFADRVRFIKRNWNEL